ncbi:MAG: AsnC family transcriptional regulator [Gammaproteobacteria bacterium]|nr:AsnC family transcriptional regulator [Gammaproteobacteria bacterium]
MKKLTDQDRALIEAIQKGLPLVSHPYAEIGEQLGLTEQEVIQRLQSLTGIGAIRRMGVVVRHRKLGYRANAMVVWDVPDARIRDLGRCFGQFEFVTLCYQRPRRLPHWRYNLFCMIHGRDREAVLANLDRLKTACGADAIPHDVLFSSRCFKQRGALYVHGGQSSEPDTRLNYG